MDKMPEQSNSEKQTDHEDPGHSFDLQGRSSKNNINAAFSEDLFVMFVVALSQRGL
jgi:hypothetical protein